MQCKETRICFLNDERQETELRRRIMNNIRHLLQLILSSWLTASIKAFQSSDNHFIPRRDFSLQQSTGNHLEFSRRDAVAFLGSSISSAILFNAKRVNAAVMRTVYMAVSD